MLKKSLLPVLDTSDDIVYQQAGALRARHCMVNPEHDPVLVRLSAALTELYGERLDRAVLFGSRARGDAGPDSDYDVAVFLKDMPDRWTEMDTLASLGTDILYDTGEVIHAMPYLAGMYHDPRMPLMHEIRREGLDL